jgi:predicted DNA-binding antitoxin AbrB/MazE fold protein
MIDVIQATYEGGVFKPDRPPALAESSRVRLVVESVGGASETSRRQQAWADLQQLWRTSTFNSQGDRLSRDELHARS